MLPFTRDRFFELFAAYNEAIWPAIPIFYLLAMIATLAAWRRHPQAGCVVSGALAVMWAWAGLVYHGLFFTRINPAAWAFAFGFLLQAVIWAFQAGSRTAFGFEDRSPVRAMAGWAMIAYALLVYPALGLLSGEAYPALPMFGVAPCPLVIFTLGLMTWASKVHWWVWIVPLVWAIIGGSAAILLSVPQDWALPIAALAALALRFKGLGKGHSSRADGAPLH
ncbi:hypothetical protein GCM10011494_39690 [Novosphingobium endophyticum]|uniref:MFS transporter permease n=1 Tax=Novosphingobium endophyticum TaxID=1955250 RepID=A0A916X7T0_9SPHN|nr:DUF6064 family protein [Novosphingobium endophyticum]GGC16864.1 hypothetical protein GCM10011494_39690 [Novosphingobium endophyticum]